MARRSLSLLVSVTAFALFISAEAYAQSAPGIILEPDKQTVKAGESLNVKISLETGPGNGTNSYIASLEYPEDKLTFESVNTETSPFSMELEAKGGDGKVSIIRGSTKALEGKLFAGTVKFKAKAETSASVVKLSKDSAIIRSSDNTNILPGSTVQKEEGLVTMQNQVNTTKPAEGFFGIINWIKNLFSSFFK